MDLEITAGAIKMPKSNGQVFRLEIPTLFLRPGETCFILGHNGSGKSTFLSWLLNGGLLGVKRSQIGIIYQSVDSNLALDLTVEQNFAVRLGVSERKVRALFRDNEKYRLLLPLALKDSLSQKARSLSLGQRQIASFLCLLIRDCRVVLLDEFLSAADYEVRTTLMSIAKNYILSTGAAGIVVSHDIRLCLAEADRIIILNDGRFFQDFRRDSSSWSEEAVINLVARGAS